MGRHTHLVVLQKRFGEDGEESLLLQVVVGENAVVAVQNHRQVARTQRVARVGNVGEYRRHDVEGGLLQTRLVLLPHRSQVQIGDRTCIHQQKTLSCENAQVVELSENVARRFAGRKVVKRDDGGGHVS